MKKLVTGSLFIALAATSVIFAANHTMHIESKSHIMDLGDQIVTLSELTKERVEDFFAGKRSEFILECTEGAILPFKLSFQGDFFALADDEVSLAIKILKTCYIKCIDETFFFSTDLQNWKGFQEFFTGMMGVSLDVNENIPTVGLNIELN